MNVQRSIPSPTVSVAEEVDTSGRFCYAMMFITNGCAVLQGLLQMETNKIEFDPRAGASGPF